MASTEGRRGALYPPGPFRQNRAMSRLGAAGVGLVVAVGLLGVAGALLGAGDLADLGRRLVAAPLPLVFGRQGGMELTARRFVLSLTLADGSAREVQGGPELAGAMRGPFARTGPLLGALTYFPVVPEPRRSALVRLALCDGGAVAEALALPAPVTRARVRSTSVHAGAEEEPELGVECRP